MGPIFKAKNVTDEEVDHLRAFLKVQGQQTPASAGTGTFAGIGILGSVGILVLFGIIWSGRYSKRTAIPPTMRFGVITVVREEHNSLCRLCRELARRLPRNAASEAL